MFRTVVLFDGELGRAKNSVEGSAKSPSVMSSPASTLRHRMRTRSQDAEIIRSKVITDGCCARRRRQPWERVKMVGEALKGAGVQAFAPLSEHISVRKALAGLRGKTS